MPAKVAVVLLSGCISASAFSSAVLFSPMCALPSRCLPGLRSQEKRGLCRPTGFLAQNVHEGKYASAAYAPVHRKPGFFMLCGDSEHKHIATSSSQAGGDGGEGGRGAGGKRGRGGRGEDEEGEDGHGPRRWQGTGYAEMIPFFVMHRRELLIGIVALVALYGRAPRSTASMTTDLWVDTPFSADDIPDVWNSDPLRHAIVTGANTGILQFAIYRT
jgi:hypothetical protein